MSEPQVYDLKMDRDTEHLWADAETRKLIIRGGIEQAKDRGCRLLRVLDCGGHQIHLEGFGTRLLDLAYRCHEQLDQEVEKKRIGVCDVHALVQDAVGFFEQNEVARARVTIKMAMDREFELFGECECSGHEELLEALGYDNVTASAEPCDMCGQDGQNHGHLLLPNHAYCSTECVTLALEEAGVTHPRP